MADLHDPSKSGQGFLVDFLASEQFGIVEKITEKPAKLPEGFGCAVNPAGYLTPSKLLWFENAEAQNVEGPLSMPAVLSIVDADEEYSVGQPVRSRASGAYETLDAAFHAAPSFSLLAE